jgi:ribosomal protein L3 glutamine methyltransferase
LKVSELLRATARRFTRAGLQYGHGTHNATEEAAWLISSVLGYLLEEKVGREKLKKIEALAARRIRERIPMAYLLKEAWLGEHAFHVDQRAIVPRSYIAELLREQFSPWQTREPRRALDLCTGSGCLAVLLCLTFRNVRVDAADLSGAALAVARKNVDRYRLKRRIRLVRSDLFSSLSGKKYDLIVSNPPYVTSSSMRRLPKEYRREPSMALAAGKDGLDLVRGILAEAGNHLTPGGLLVCEIGGNRAALEHAYPRLEFAWPETSEGSGCVFILQRQQLPPAARTVSSTRARPRPARLRR